MKEFETLHDIVLAAHRNLAREAWDYLVGGADTETSVLRNRQSLDSLAFQPTVLKDVRTVDLSATVHGCQSRLPVVLAPMGSLETLHPGGALSVARAAQSFGVISYLSSVTEPGIEEIARETSHAKVFQLYVRGDRNWIAESVSRAIDLGYVQFCITVDVAHYSRRERDLINRYRPSARVRHQAGWEYQAGMTWDLVKWFKDSFEIPLILKGIATAGDAFLCIEHGVDGVYVSNHGGRQLDHNRGAVDSLPEIVQAVDGRAEVIVDGGFCRGTDIAKGLALGADAVGIGKIQGLGLGAAGEAGVIRVLELLETELEIAMGLLGLTRVADLKKDCLVPANPVGTPGVLSAFPFLNLPAKEIT